MSATGTYPSVVTSPATTTSPVVTSVSTATRLCGSAASSASHTESLIWSAILSGCPSVTDSDVNRRPVTTRSPRLDAQPRYPSLRRRLTVSVFGPAVHDVIPDHVRELALGTGRDGGPSPVSREEHRLVLVPAEHAAAAD